MHVSVWVGAVVSVSVLHTAGIYMYMLYKHVWFNAYAVYSMYLSTNSKSRLYHFTLIYSTLLVVFTIWLFLCFTFMLCYVFSIPIASCECVVLSISWLMLASGISCPMSCETVSVFGLHVCLLAYMIRR